ncbi:MAG: ABC transporter ATP-binding protein, partial [Anaerolinea sp.]|nr:ABC transporter ATP-binding protein [Anaerolinea sp.]
GIIGRNGAGKSTLLKVLSRITKPTTGRVDLYGRVGSLLEVGTGFHPELTGRENIYLNGAILGMRRAEIERKFDEIVDFAEIEKFLDTQVKFYSSGMYMRLAFAVASHMEPEILVVDEVLAVGDAEFQKKSLGKMGDVAKQGRTVLFVSHAMAAVQSLCTRGILLQNGKIVFDGTAVKAIQTYGNQWTQRSSKVSFEENKSRSGSGEIRATFFCIEDENGVPSVTIRNGQKCTLVIGYKTNIPNKSFDGVAATVNVRSELGTYVFYHHNLLSGQSFDNVSGEGEFRLTIPRLPLSEGGYFFDIAISTDRGRTVLDLLYSAAYTEVIAGDFFGIGFEYKGGASALVLVDGEWQIRRYGN